MEIRILKNKLKSFVATVGAVTAQLYLFDEVRIIHAHLQTYRHTTDTIDVRIFYTFVNTRSVYNSLWARYIVRVANLNCFSHHIRH